MHTQPVIHESLNGGCYHFIGTLALSNARCIQLRLLTPTSKVHMYFSRCPHMIGRICIQTTFQASASSTEEINNKSILHKHTYQNIIHSTYIANTLRQLYHFDNIRFPMNGKNTELMSTNIKSENDALRHSLHRTQQNLSSKERSPSTSSTRRLDGQPEAYSKRRGRRRTSSPIDVPSPRRPSHISTSSEEEEGFLWGSGLQAWDDSMATTSYRTRKSVSFSIETQHSYYSPLSSTLPAMTMSPQTGHLKSLPSEELRRRGPLIPKERLFAEEDSMEGVYTEKDRTGHDGTNGRVNGREGTVHKRPDTPMTTLLMKMTEL